MQGSHRWTGWGNLIASERWSAYQRVLEEAISRRLPFALGGGFATATHTGRWRDTNDMDLYVLPRDRNLMVSVIEGTGLKDVHDELPYDRDWTYRATDGNVIVEAIWTMRNHRADVDQPWLERGPRINIRGLELQVAAPEEMIWAKLYVMMRERCDWPDVLNYIYFCGGGLDWQHLLERLGEDRPLLGAVLAVFSWISPQRLEMIPTWVWERVDLRIPVAGSASDELRHAALFSTRSWFGPMAQSARLEKTG